MLRGLPLKAVYRSEEDNILEDFYIPALSASRKYDRAVGYFSAGMLSYAAQGLSAFIENEGTIRLLFGGELTSEDFAAIAQGYELKKISEKLGKGFVHAIEGVADVLFFKRLEALSWLIAANRLEIKVALKRQGMYHEKIGIFRDEEDNTVVFQGSANETTSALLPDFNFESINVFQGWRPELHDHCVPHIQGFERLWANNARNTIVLDFPDAAKEKIIRVYNPHRRIQKDTEIELWRKQSAEPVGDPVRAYDPQIPLTFGGRDFEIMPHQKKALQSWQAHDMQGIMALATGAGKTITAIYGAIKIYQAAGQLFLVIAVPYQNLADQWVSTLAEFNIFAIQCYGSVNQWRDSLSQCLALFQTGGMKFVCVVVVNRTLQSQDFQNCLQQIPGDNLLWVGDECHHHSSQGLSQKLPAQAKRRLGLSATPEHYANAAATDRLLEYYGPIVANYSLKDALLDGVLTPYRYHIVLVDLTPEESDAYRDLSDKIAKLVAQLGTGDPESSSDQRLSMLLFQRARILGSAQNKLVALRELLKTQGPVPLSLFYCGDGRTEDEDNDQTEPLRQVQRVSSLLDEFGWRNSHFTSYESRQDRRSTLDNFRIGLIHAMVAIRCLDEGIDVPACQRAYILASSRNPKQFIQRRGRILRRAPNKDFAEIFDFVVTIPDALGEDDSCERRLFLGELKRVTEFAMLSMNPADSRNTLKPLLEKYDASHYFV